MTKQNRAHATRRQLIRSAAEAFARHGYLRARLAEISAEAGVSPGGLHFHFESKAALAEAVKAEAALALSAVAGHAYRSRRPALQALADASHQLIALLREDVVVRAGFQLSREDGEGTGLSLPQEWQSCVQHLLAEAGREHSLATGVSQQDAAIAVVAATVGLEALGRDNREWLSRKTLTGFWRVLLPRLAAAPLLPQLEPAGHQLPISD